MSLRKYSKDWLQELCAESYSLAEVLRKAGRAQGGGSQATLRKKIAEYKIDIFDKTLYDFENLRYNTDKVLSSEEIFIEKKNKKGLLKKTDIRPSIKSYRFEDESLFIVLKTGQNTGVPALRADVLMNLIAPDVIFNIKRCRFFDENLKEL